MNGVGMKTNQQLRAPKFAYVDHDCMHDQVTEKKLKIIVEMIRRSQGTLSEVFSAISVNFTTDA